MRLLKRRWVYFFSLGLWELGELFFCELKHRLVAISACLTGWSHGRTSSNHQLLQVVNTSCASRMHMGMGQNPIPLVNIKIAGKWMVHPPKNGMYRYWSIAICIQVAKNCSNPCLLVIFQFVLMKIRPRKGCVKNLSELIKYLDVRDLRIVTGP